MTTTDVEPLIHDLDRLYQETLERLERQTRDAIFIDNALRRLLDQAPDDAAILNWDPQRAINPRHAFRSLALRVVATAQSSVARGQALSPVDYDDLLTWADEPGRTGESPTADFLRCIDFAKGQSLADFWARLRGRIAPDIDPDQAARQAAEDLLVGFAVTLPQDRVVPYTQHGGAISLHLPLRRHEDDIEWVITPLQLQCVSRSNHALSTLCLLDGRLRAAEAIHDATGVIHSRLRANFRQFKQRDCFHAGAELRVFFCRDFVDYRFDPDLFAMVRERMHAHAPDLQFVPSHILLRTS